MLVTNDEMGDHIFELLGYNLFPRWKERHQVCKYLVWYLSFINIKEINHLLSILRYNVS